MANYFKKYENIPQIQDLYKEKNLIINELVSQISEDFEAFEKDTSLLKAEDLTHACYIIEILGEKYFQNFISTFCKMLLKPYQDLYNQP